jgi:hypothetical protein
VIEALDSLYISIKEDLLIDTKEDQKIQRRIATITKEVLDHKKLETAMNDILHKKLAATINDAIEKQLKGIQSETKKKPEQHITKILEPLEQTK